MTTHNDSWEERCRSFVEKYSQSGMFDNLNALGNGEELLQDFIRTEIAAAEKRKVAEIVEKVREFYEHNKGDEYGLNQDFSDGWDAGLKNLLNSLLQAEDEGV